MESILHFCKTHQKTITKHDSIVIYLGSILCEHHVLSKEYPEEKAKTLSKHLAGFSKPTIRHSRVYKHLNQEYHIVDANEEHFKTQYHHQQMVKLESDKGLMALFKTSVPQPLELFPSRQEYHDIINRSEYIFDIEKLYQLCVVYEETSRKHTWSVEIRIHHSNIHEKRLLSSLQETIQTLLTFA
jgi:hypothetical protein